MSELDDAAVKYATGRAGSLPTPSFTDNREAFLAGAEHMRLQFTLHGTTDCRECDDGRATLYATLKGYCIQCHHKRMAAKQAAPVIPVKLREFKNPICRGSYVLGSACGRCERCELERSNPMHQCPPHELPCEACAEKYGALKVRPNQDGTDD